MNKHALRKWFSRLDQCTTFGQVNELWESTVEDADVRPCNFDGRFTDAIVSFLACSQMPDHWKLAAVLGHVSHFDLDPELAFGAVDVCFESEDENDPRLLPGADPAAGTLKLTGIPPFFSGYIHGRYAEVARRLVATDRKLLRSRERFWSAYLETCCRAHDIEGAETALQNGGTPAHNGFAALKVACQSDCWAMVAKLRQHARNDPRFEVAALCAAAAANNVNILELLLEHGAQIDCGDGAALTAAASTYSLDACDWLIESGADVQAGAGSALIAAVSTLSADLVQTFIEAGADASVNRQQALYTAFTADSAIYWPERSEFASDRADTILVLLTAGAKLAGMEVDEFLLMRSDIADVLDRLLDNGELSAENREVAAHIRSLIDQQRKG
ncbi:Ankyrin repeats (3 copies) [Caballeronia concitans]|uniref:Ankyrin repeats (3 copies) n=1 Tax=Caballeronia concitans TaxID=1777133 RepID=A0A658R475_9BURK|nr:Ankyrin repeats (3 copies) [Caballeronia concitans]